MKWKEDEINFTELATQVDSDCIKSLNYKEDQ